MLAGRRIALLFYESSTRTRTSFELAAKSLGATTTLVSDKSSSIEKGESLKDTGLTLRALGAECIILRHPASGAPYLLARDDGAAGAECGRRHACSILRRRCWICGRCWRGCRAWMRRGRLMRRRCDGVTVVITGDILHSRVARSNAMLLPRLGARVLLCGPPELLPEDALGLGAGLRLSGTSIRRCGRRRWR